MENKFTAIIDKVSEFFSTNDIPAEVVSKEATTEEEVKEKFETVLLADGETEATIEPAVEVGAAIVLTSTDGTPVAAPVGEYELQDGRVIVVEEEGVVALVNEVSEEVVEEEPMASDEPDEASKVKRVIESIVKEKVFASSEEVSEAIKNAEFSVEESKAILERQVELEKFVKEALEQILEVVSKEPSKEEAVTKKDPLKHFKKDADNYLMPKLKTNE